MDALDYRIPTQLSDNARRPFAELARELGVSQPTVAERVRRMEERGVILGSSLRLDYGKLGFPITALVRIVLNTRDQYRLEDIARGQPQVVEMHRLTGEDSLIARVVARSVEDLAAVIETLCQFGQSNTSLVVSTPIPVRSPIDALMPRKTKATTPAKPT